MKDWKLFASLVESKHCEMVLEDEWTKETMSMPILYMQGPKGQKILLLSKHDPTSQVKPAVNKGVAEGLCDIYIYAAEVWTSPSIDEDSDPEMVKRYNNPTIKVSEQPDKQEKLVFLMGTIDGKQASADYHIVRDKNNRITNLIKNRDFEPDCSVITGEKIP